MFEKLNDKSFGVKAGLGALLAVIIVVAAYFMPDLGVVTGVAAMETKNAQALKDLNAKKAENQNLKQYESRLADLDRQIVSLKQQMELQKSIVPDEKDADKFIVILQETATNAGVQLRKLDAKTTVNKDYYAELPFEIEVDGPFYGVLNFFDKLSTQARIVNVEGLAMKTTKGETKYPIAPTDSVKVV